MLNSSTGLFFFQFSSTDGLNSMLENGPWFIRNHPLILRKWNPDVDLLKEGVRNVPGRSNYARAMIKLRADVELKDTIVVVMPKIMNRGGMSKNIGLGVAKNLKKPSQTSRGVPVGSKVGFKPHKEYRHVSKKPTASSSGTNERTTNLVNNRVNSSGFSFMNVENNSTRTNPIIDKIGKFKDLLISGQAILVDEAGNPLKKVECLGDYDSKDEVASVDNDMARSMASEKDLPQEIQAICDNLETKVRGRKKK
ncbi:hypothetical protein Tco_0578949 [Tanacetum coccineum]